MRGIGTGSDTQGSQPLCRCFCACEKCNGQNPLDPMLTYTHINITHIHTNYWKTLSIIVACLFDSQKELYATSKATIIPRAMWHIHVLHSFQTKRFAGSSSVITCCYQRMNLEPFPLHYRLFSLVRLGVTSLISSHPSTHSSVHPIFVSLFIFRRGGGGHYLFSAPT